MRSTHLGRRMTALLAAGAIATTLGVALTPAAQAATSLGTLSITPATGNESNALTATTSSSCPAGSTGLIGYMSGPGITEQNNGVAQSIIQGNRPANETTFPLSGIFKDVFQANSISAPSGVFTVRIACIGPDFFSEVGEFAQTVTFTPRSAPNGGTYVANPAAKPATQTTLATPTPVDPVVQGTSVTLQATVTSGEGTPAGTVQFKSGATNLGAPVALAAGVASLSTMAIPAGAGALTAVYLPGANNFATSTSAGQAYIVAGATTLTGTSRVGATRGCTAVTGGTKTYSWLKNNVPTGITTASVVVPAAWVNAAISCTLTSTKGGTSVSRTSTAVKVAAGAAPVARVKPKVLGTTKVGKTVTCSRGTWSPAPTTYKYTWLRSGKVIPRKTAAKYKLVKADKKKAVSCRVTVLKSGYLNGVATSPARKVT
ncbi:Ig-like domain-containing protein [Nocardioides marmoriginsengisoli]|nr:Ig-like domain-containing protein [Nocardioides marmoriginsengisoli]